MKKMLMVMISILCLCGCGSSLGSFEDGTLDHTELIRRLNSASVENGWQLMMLKENADTGGLQRYGLRTEDVVSYGIYPAVLQAVGAYLCGKPTAGYCFAAFLYRGAKIL